MSKRQIDPNDPRVLACKQAKERAGGYSELARQLGIKRQATFGWQMVPIERCHAVAGITGISVYELRPDIFGQLPAHQTA